MVGEKSLCKSRRIGNAVITPAPLSGIVSETFADTRRFLGLGPMSTSPHRQRQGVGSALVREGLRQMEQAGAVYSWAILPFTVG